MAESELKMALAKEHIPETNCEICMEDDRKSHILPCGHGLCLVCIDSLVNDGEFLECPFCRKVCKTSDEGFPTNQLSEFRKVRIPTVSSKEEKGHATVKSRRCCNCKEDIKAMCQICRRFFCYECTFKTLCDDHDGRHKAEPLDKVLEKSEDKLKTWKVVTRYDICLLEKIAEIRQKEIDEKKSVLKAAEMINSFMDVAEKITMINQICWPNGITHTDDTSSIPDVPSRLKLISQYETGDNCHSVCFNKRTGDLLLGCADGMKIITRGSYEVKEETQHRKAITAVHKGEVFISQHQDRKVIKIFSYNVESKESEMLFSFPMEKKKVSHMTVSDEFVARIDKDTQTLKLYDRGEKTVQTLPLPGLTQVIYNIYFIQDGSLLATGAENGRYLLNKYRISTRKEAAGEVITLIWSCPLTKACGIAVSDDEKLIFVSELNAKRIYVVRPDGKRLCELNSDELPQTNGDISLYNNILAAAGWDAKTVSLFKII